MEKKTVALIELGGSHDECIYSQVLFLKKNGIRVQVILFRDHLNRMEVFPEVDIWKTFPKPRGWLAEWVLVFRLLAYLKAQGRFSHMSDSDIAEYQKIVDKEFEELLRREEMGTT